MPDDWDGLSMQLQQAGIPTPTGIAIRKTLAGLVDPSPGKSGIVRDRSLRDTLRRCVRAAGLDPDSLTPKQAEELARRGAFRYPDGTPIRSVVLLQSNTAPVVVARTVPTGVNGERQVSTSDREDRIYQGQNNHHIEIRENGKGKWAGTIITTFEAVGRNRERLKARRAACSSLGLPPRTAPGTNATLAALFREIDAKRSIVERHDNADGRFIMSLAEGETVLMKHPDTGELGYFVLFKLDKPQTMHFKHHWDSRRAMGVRDLNGDIVANSEREDIAVSATQLKHLAPSLQPPGTSVSERAAGQPPERLLKCRLSPLGDPRQVYAD
jgi:hypothetical protein